MIGTESLIRLFDFKELVIFIFFDTTKNMANSLHNNELRKYEYNDVLCRFFFEECNRILQIEISYGHVLLSSKNC